MTLHALLGRHGVDRGLVDVDRQQVLHGDLRWFARRRVGRVQPTDVDAPPSSTELARCRSSSRQRRCSTIRARVADRLAADLEHGHDGLARQLLDLRRARRAATGPAAPRPRSRAGPARAPPARTRTGGSSASCSGAARRGPSARKIGSGAMSGVAVVTDTTQYLPQEVVDRHGLSLVSLYVNWDGRTDRESDMPGYDAFYDVPQARRRRPAEHLAAVGRRLPRRLRAAARARRRRRLDPPLGRHLRHGALGRAGARRARRARRRRRAGSWCWTRARAPPATG